MTTPMPTDHEIARELEVALRAEAERITPDPALHRILARAREGERPRADRRRRWLPALAGAVATAGLAAAAVVIFAPSDDPSRPTDPPVPCAVEVRAGCPVELAVYWTRSDMETVLSAGVDVTSSGDVGVDAVQALLNASSNDQFVNAWHGYDTAPPDAGPVAEVNEVSHAGGVVTVDFDRPLTGPLASAQGDPRFGEPIVQQLVLTTQSALRTDDPVLITVNGEAAAEAFGTPLSGPVPADPSLVDGIRVSRPAQQMVVDSPVRISGKSDTFEANVLWEISRADEVVRDGFTSGGTMGVFAGFEFEANLPPGDYTLKLWEPNEASGAEAWAEELAVVYIDFTVE